MKWQFLSLIFVVIAAVMLVWRSSGKKPAGGGCNCGCAHEPGAEHKKETAAR